MIKTTSYEISKKLKEAGFEAEGDFGYRVPDSLNDLKAYGLETILDALRQTRKRIMIVVSSNNWGINFNYEFNIYSKENESLADTAGRMWLMLKEKGVL